MKLKPIEIANLLSTRFDPSKRISAKAALDHHYFRCQLHSTTNKHLFYLKKPENLFFSDLDKTTLPAKPGQFDLPV